MPGKLNVGLSGITCALSFHQASSAMGKNSKTEQGADHIQEVNRQVVLEQSSMLRQAGVLLSSTFEDASAKVATDVILGTNDLPKVSSKGPELST